MPSTTATSTDQVRSEASFRPLLVANEGIFPPAEKIGDPPGWREWDEEEEGPEIEKALDSITGHMKGASERFTGLLKNLELGIATEAHTQ